MTGQKHYVSYLLRLWWVDAPAESGWRASLESPRTGEQLGFGSLERLFAFLLDQTSVDQESIDLIRLGTDTDCPDRVHLDRTSDRQDSSDHQDNS